MKLTPLEIIFQRNDFKLLIKFIKAYKNAKFAGIKPIGLKYVDTGSNPSSAYGMKVAKV